MLGNSLYQKFIPNDYDVFGGIDVDKKRMSITFTDHQHNLKSISMPAKAEDLIHYASKHFPSKRMAFAYEAGPTGYGLYDQLTAQKYPCLVVAPSMVPTPPGQQVKTNRLDSRKIAESLRGGQLKSIHVPSPVYRQLRHLTQLRDTFIQDVAAFKCRIKALLLFEGIAFPEAPAGRGQWSVRVIHELRHLPCGESARFKLDQLLSALEFNCAQTLETQKEIRRFCSNDPELSHCIRYLMSIPGIGWIVGAHLLARIGDWRFLTNVRQIAGFLGLVPRENSTGERIRRGAITKVGGRLQAKLIQSAWASIRQDAELAAFYQTVYQKHPRDRASRKAIVAVARKLTTRIYCVLKEQRPYIIR